MRRKLVTDVTFCGIILEDLRGCIIEQHNSIAICQVKILFGTRIFFNMISRITTRAPARLSQLSSQLSRSFSQSPGTMSYPKTELTLNTGAKIPAIGFGTWQDKDSQSDAVYEALKAGYRHIDTARVYGTEPACADGIKRSGVPRKEIFITTKLWNNDHHPDDVEKACDASLKDLNTDYLDLFLMHWPSPFARSESLFPKDSDGSTKKGDTDYVDTWKAMEKLVKNGKCRAIGVSNFSQAELERLLKSAAIKPAAHQIECHPYLAQARLQNFMRRTTFTSPNTLLLATRMRSTTQERISAN